MPLEENFDPNAPQPQHSNEPSQQPANEPQSARGPNNLPEANDKTTERIHSLSNFNVSDKLGLPLLTKDIKTNGSQPRDLGAGAVARDESGNSGGPFGLFSSRDRLVLAASAIMILGPLFFGMMRG